MTEQNKDTATRKLLSADDEPAVIQLVAVKNGRAVVVGIPAHFPSLPDDHPWQHDCDANGCTTLEHILWRGPVQDESDAAPAPAAGDGDIVADLREWAKVCEGVGGISRCEVLLRAATIVTELRRDLRRYENAHKTVMEDNKRLTAMVQQRWLPIESAPKDAEELLLARGKRVTSGNYWRETEQDRGEPDRWLSWDGGFTEEEPPTHFQPLPPPPEEVKS